MAKQKDTQYLYLSARLQVLEASMLTRQRAERLLEARTRADEARILEECGLRGAESLSSAELEETVARRQSEAFAGTAAEAPDRRIVDAFRVKYDCHNLKVLVKCEASGTDPLQPGLMSRCGTVSPEELKKGFFSGDMPDLRPELSEAVRAARETLAKTNDARLSDSVLDAACFKAMLALSQEAECPFLTDYVRAQIDGANLRTAVRCRRLERDEAFLRRMLLEGGTVPAEAVIAAARDGKLQEAFGRTEFAAAAAAGDGLDEDTPVTEMERLCDDAGTKSLASAALEGFGPRVLVLYLAAAERESMALRLILTGKASGVPTQTIRERMRELVV